MVAAASPSAAAAGCRVLRDGGSAADAAVAVQAVLAVVEPQSSGLGGGSQITYWDSGRHRVRFFEGLSQAPEVVTEGLGVPTAAEQQGHHVRAFDESVEHTGRAVGVPGTVRVLGQVHRAYGNRPWSTLFSAAHGLATQGFPVSPYLHDMAREGCLHPDVRARYCDGDKPKPVGAKVVNRELAQVLREVAAGGPGAFYAPAGTIAPAVVARVRAGHFKARTDNHGPAVIPSLMTVKDFAGYRSHERTPLCGGVFGHRLCTAPPPSYGGIDVLTLLALAERKGIAELAPDTAGQAHLAIEASRLADVDARAYTGDPAFTHVPLAALRDPAYLDRRAAWISPTTAVHPVRPGLPSGLSDASAGNDATSQVSIVDTYGNALSMTTTVNMNFGAGMEARGIILNNVLTNFSRTPAAGRPNTMEPNKRPVTSMAPTLVLDPGDRLRLVAGSAGGNPIPDYVAQQILGTIVYGMNPQEALGQSHISGQTTVADCGGQPDVRSDVERGTAAERFLPRLTALGHPCVAAVPLRSGAALVEVTPGGLLRGAADPRRDGTAMGY
ncbi:gamma-glutamyltransferase [Streptomyces olivoreticuli]|uniref:gamma-glutamyltransferase family protein n=1 Tax=Streptomyces olivoreticuli TaxID=68246 RepID=UPI00265A02BA|nr:gamma-glutamyltransferase [Streptomyces olivoreticuli]WKK23908.1 gamma-glutamyltransferase [Streptomyces olivoreticuli]